MSEKLRKVLMFICVAIFLFSAVRLGMYFMEYKKGDDIYKEARQFVVTSQGITQTEEEESRQIDFESLMAINEDIRAWIYIEDTPVDYPILMGIDNVYYLNRTYDKQWSSFGSIFLDQENTGDFTDKHIVLYGHNMKNESMFGAMDKYLKQDYADAHPYVHIYTPQGEMIYQIFSVYTTHVEDITYQIQVETEADMLELASFMNNKTAVQTGVMAGLNDQILTLSTCTPAGSNTHRIVINAILLEDNRELPLSETTASEEDITALHIEE